MGRSSGEYSRRFRSNIGRLSLQMPIQLVVRTPSTPPRPSGHTCPLSGATFHTSRSRVSREELGSSREIGEDCESYRTWSGRAKARRGGEGVAAQQWDVVMQIAARRGEARRSAGSAERYAAREAPSGTHVQVDAAGDRAVHRLNDLA